MSKCIEIIGSHEEVRFETVEELSHALTCYRDEKIKVVSIFGSTGAGKSHCLNRLFFPNGSIVFPETGKPQGGPAGVWGSLWRDPSGELDNVLVLDTEGLMGVIENPEHEDDKNRILLKVLALSDVVIFRKWGERLTADVFHFLEEASSAFKNFFQEELALTAADLQLPAQNLGAAVIIFHETVRSELLTTKSFLPVEGDAVSTTTSPYSSHLNPSEFAEVFQRGYRGVIRQDGDRRPAFEAFASVEYIGERPKEAGADVS